MKERLIIKNFGPIKSVDLELGMMTVLIGEQATGKSTIAKVLSVCRFFSYIANHFVGSNGFKQGLIDWGIDSFYQKDTEIIYENDDYKFFVSSFEFEGKKTDTPFPEIKVKSKRFISLYNKYLKSYDVAVKLNKNKPLIFTPWSPGENFYRIDVKEVMENPFFFPTERGLQSIFSLGKSSLNNMSDSLFNQLALLDGIFKRFLVETEIEPLDIYFKYDNNQSFTRSKNSKNFYSLRNGASGFQSAIPIVLAIKFYTEFEKRRRTFIIEEPEINLFPKAQKKLVDFFAESMNNFNHQFLLPTHSPYILSSLNNLMYAYKVANDFNANAEVEKVIPKEYWMNPENIEVYFLENGEAKSLIDKEEGLINIDELDSVSEIVNKEFDQLLAIEIKHSEND